MSEITIICCPICQLSTLQWNPLVLLPSKVGFRFIGLRKDGLQILCETRKVDKTIAIKPGSITNYSGWRYITKADEKAIQNRF